MIDVVIIGAGISGLTCARELSGYGSHINLVVLEASDRVGGRIRTIRADDGTTLELGAHYIHGTEKNPLYDFVMSKGVVEGEIEIQGLPSTGVECFPKELVYECSEQQITKYVDIGNRYIEKFKTDLRKLSEAEMSLYKTVGDYMLNRFDLTLRKYAHNEHLHDAIKSVFLYWINAEKHNSGCTSVFDLDLRGFLNYMNLEGDPYFVVSDHCPNGYQDVVNAIVNDIKMNCIHLNCEVNGIENVLVHGITKIKVTCSNGKTFYADTTVMTVSVGALKHFLKSNVFTIELPETKRQSIEKLHLGNVLKIYFKFLTPIEDNISSFTFYPSSKVFNFLDFDKENRLFQIERVGDSDWWLYWVICDEGFKLEDPVLYMNKTMTSFSDTYPDFPDHKVDETTIIVSDWVTNQFYRGCYSYLKPGTDEREIANLAEPVSYGEANLLFAGEATSRHFFSSTHGAYMSGIREAANIKAMYGLTSNI